MRSLRSVAAGGRDVARDVAKEAFTAFAKQFPTKLYWFLSQGYKPHEWQGAFHAADYNGRLVRFRHLVAGRRGGKTLSAAWETLFYCLHPEEFHRDAHSVDSSRPLWVWVLAKDHEVGRPARMAMQAAMNQVGLVKDRDYKWNKTEKTIEFENGTFLQFKTADDPQSLRGAGLDILWIDEAAFVTSKEAWVVARPALSDKIGLVVTTTTPQGKNWFWEEFFTGAALTDPLQFRVEYTSLDSPYFAREEWEYAAANMHPSHFAQEYMAAFDAMAGLTLSGEWLHYWGAEAKGDQIALPKGEDGRARLHKFLGIDPSTGESEDSFAMVLLGVSEDRDQAFLLDYYKGKIMFPDQVDKIREWQIKYRPELIGIESNAFQKVLAQQANRLQGFPGVVPVLSKGKKPERIVSMSPLFKIGKVRIQKTHVEFIDEWVSYNAKQRDNRDDLLDAAEIAIGVAGVLLPTMQYEEPSFRGPPSLEEEARLQVLGLSDRGQSYDQELGSEA